MNNITLIEVGPRDGLQGLTPLSMTDRLALIHGLAEVGLKHIEVGAMVSAKRIPAMANSEKVLIEANKFGITASVLVPNLEGLELALQCDAKHIAVFTAASELFSQANSHCSINESLQRLYPVIEQAKSNGLAIRGYLSCIVDCPFTGAIPAAQVASIATELFSMGCDEISLGDTLGHAVPNQIASVIEQVSATIPLSALSGHYHNTYGMALANVIRSIELGITRFDTSAAGLGGCPYAPGASGNLATEELLWYCERNHLKTGVNLQHLIQKNRAWCQRVGITPGTGLLHSG
ncbi:hydroxymethylglutaryl-CoA lyase [Thaumasiovibrio sp. DFM-14]|uniref:hydroxymethylglutaryl-CoA lyase n=1 Tax=Thaumasiovibrio sp. DFM-14 TaxID=3384792 RepID=UPI0039A16483